MSLLTQNSIDFKKELKKAYLSGITVQELCQEYKFKYTRTIYFHLQPLTAEEKLKHQTNRLKLLKEKEKQNGRTS